MNLAGTVLLTSQRVPHLGHGCVLLPSVIQSPVGRPTTYRNSVPRESPIQEFRPREFPCTPSSILQPSSAHVAYRRRPAARHGPVESETIVDDSPGSAWHT